MLLADGKIRSVHHMNCATFRPVPRVEIVTHVLAVEYDHGVVLVDSGLGTADVANSVRRLGVPSATVRPALRPAETAVEQLARLGFSAGDVTGIVATHLDYDHIGGANDFPTAAVHTLSQELTAALNPITRSERLRYRPAHLNALTNFETYDEVGESMVLGLSSHQLDAVGAMYLAAMPGHTRGHAAVAIRDPQRGWLVHAGDAAMHRGAFTQESRTPWPYRAAEHLLAVEKRFLAGNHATLTSLKQSGHRVFCSHDATQFKALANEQSST